jgi:hypothetical protein
MAQLQIFRKQLFGNSVNARMGPTNAARSLGES